MELHHQCIINTPKKYIINFPVDNNNELDFVSKNKKILAIIRLYVNKIIIYPKQTKIVCMFFSKNIGCNGIVVEINFFNKMPYILQEKKFFVFKGAIDHKNNKYIMLQPIILSSNAIHLFSIEPIYSSNIIKNNKTKKLVSTAMLHESFQSNLNVEWLPMTIINHFKWQTFYNSLQFLHNPVIKPSINKIPMAEEFEITLQASINRIALDELVNHYRVHMNLRENKTKKPLSPGKYVNEFLSQWTLTNSQSKALEEIFHDMAQEKKMFRLLYGEVGSGKTILAFAAALNAVDNGKQAAIIAPTQILAEQMYQKFIMQTKIQCLLVTSASKIKAQHISINDALVVIGTHAICNFSYEDLAIIIFDEQHRFGVKQRLKLINQESLADILFMSATPIPRTLFMVRYKFMDVSYLDGNRSNVESHLFPVELVHKVISRTSVWMENKEKIFWVCAAINDFKDIVGCESRFNLIKKHLDNSNIWLIHSKQEKSIQKTNIDSFITADYGILVATSIIEVGINIPDSSIIIIENAERFGLSQLHQLRGRVGRNGQNGKCLFLYKETTDDIDRMNFIVNNNSCRSLSDFDLQNRGTGSIKGFKQQGKTNWKFAGDTPAEWLLNLANKICQYNILQPEFVKDFFKIDDNIDSTLIS